MTYLGRIAIHRITALIVAVGATGCASSDYRPAASPLVSRTSEAGGFVYYRDGRKYDRLVDAVEGNPRAVAEARTAHTLNIWAGSLVYGALGIEIAGFTMIGAGQNDSVKTAGGGLVLASLGGVFAAIWVAAYSLPHQQDAINIYNDGVLRRTTIPPFQKPVSSPASEEH